MAMTNQEATACQTLVAFLTGQTMGGQRATVGEADALAALATVAQRSYERFGAGINATTMTPDAELYPRRWTASAGELQDA